MKYPHPDRSRLRRLVLFQASLALAITTTWAQVAAPPTTPAPTDETKPVDKKISVEKNDKPETDIKSLESEAVILSPFEVTSERDRGYRGGSSMSGTRMGADLDDIANPMSVVTKQQLNDFAMHDINDIFASELGVEGTHTFTANGNDGRADVDSVALNPETANRVRGLGAANISLGNFGRSSTIPIDTYNVDAVEISRGPNSSIFGMGEASGTVNLVPSAANLTLDFSRTSLSYSSYGTARGTIDLNRPIFKGKLALRLNALQEAKGYQREPSFDKTRRYQLSLTAKPFKYTTIRASYENFRERFSRPNSMTATDYVSLWKQAGSPSWNPFTNTWSYKAFTNPVNGISYPGGTGLLNPTGSTDTNQYYNGTTNGTPAIGPLPPAGALWLAGFGSTRVRPVMFIDNGQVEWAGTQLWVNASAPTNNNRHELVGFALPANYNVPIEYRGTLPYRAITASTDKSFYDYESLSLSGLNRGAKDAGTTRLELEQFLLTTPIHMVAFQLGFFKEQITETSRSFVGSGGDGVRLDIFPDVNITLPDGTPNSHYGSPYMSALAPQTYTKPINTKTYRANLVYQLDLSKQKNFLRFLGTSKLLGYAETFDKVYAKNSLRYQDQVVDVLNPWYNNSIRNNNDGKFLTRYYLGDGDGGNVDHGSSGVPENLKITYNRYGSRAASVATPPNPAFPAERTGWYAINDVNIGSAYFSQGKQNVETTTQGFILQNYLVKNRVITTWGRRRDTLRTRETGTGNIARSLLEPASAVDPLSPRSLGLTTSAAARGTSSTGKPAQPSPSASPTTKASSSRYSPGSTCATMNRPALSPRTSPSTFSKTPCQTAVARAKITASC